MTRALCVCAVALLTLTPLVRQARAADGAENCAASYVQQIFFPDRAPWYFAITLVPDGAATYNESEDPDNSEAVHLEPAATKQAFELCRTGSAVSKKPLESGLKIANMGQKTLRWEQGAEKNEAKYNYSIIDDAKTLGDIFERIAESTRMILELRRALKHDRLGVNDAVLHIPRGLG